MNTEVGDKETTDELLGYKPMNVGETIEGGYDLLLLKGIMPTKMRIRKS